MPWDKDEKREMGLSDDWVDHWNRKLRSLGLSWDFAKALDGQEVKGKAVLSPVAGYVYQVPAERAQSDYGTYVDVQTDAGWSLRLAHMIEGSAVLTRYDGVWIPRGVPVGDLGSTGKSTAPHIHMELFWYRGQPPPVGDTLERGLRARFPGTLRPFGVDQEALNNRTDKKKDVAGNQSRYKPELDVIDNIELLPWHSEKAIDSPKWVLYLGTKQWSSLHEYRVMLKLATSTSVVYDTGWVAVDSPAGTCGFFILPTPQPGMSSWNKLRSGRYEWIAQVRFPDIREGHEGEWFESDKVSESVRVLDLKRLDDRVLWGMYRLFKRPVRASETVDKIRLDPPAPLPSPEEMAEKAQEVSEGPAPIDQPAPLPRPASAPHLVIGADTVAYVVQLGRLGKGQITNLAYHGSGRLLAVASSVGIHLYDILDLAEVAFLEMDAEATNVAFSPGGETLVSWSPNHRNVRLWRVTDGVLLRTFQGHTEPLTDVAFSPDGQILATTSLDPMDSIFLWRVEDGALVHTLRAHARRVSSLAFSPDGRTLATGSWDSTIRLWRVSDGTIAHTLRAHTNSVSSVAFSPDGQTLASGSWDSTIRLWRVEDGALLLTLREHSDKTWGDFEVYHVAFSPNGQTLVSRAEDGTAKLWRVSDGTLLQTINNEPVSAVRKVIFSPEGKTLATISSDASVQLWDATSGAFLRTLETEARLGPWPFYRSPVFSPGGDALAIPCLDTVSFWRVADGALLGTLEDIRTIWSLAFSPDSEILATASNKHSIELSRVTDGTPLGTLRGHTGAVRSVAFSPDGQTLASGSTDATVWLWRVSDRAPLATLKGHSDTVTSLAFSPDGRTLASGSEDETVWLWRVSDGAPLDTQQGYQGKVTSLAFSPDGQTLASGFAGGTTWLWRVSDGAPPFILGDAGAGRTDQVSIVAFSPDGQTIATESSNAVRVWRVADGTLLRTLMGNAEGVPILTFSPDGQILATNASDDTIQLWRTADRSSLRTLGGYGCEIHSLVFSPNGQTLASGCGDGTVRLWRVADATLLRTLEGHSQIVRSVVFSPDGQTLASTSEDGTVRLWGVAR